LNGISASLTLLASARPEASAANSLGALQGELSARLAHGNVLVLSGAGVSTDSGIPGYRDEHGVWKGRAPIQYREFVGSEAVRRRYWARSLIGYPVISRAVPNAAHYALQELEARGALSLLVTQNVDGLHRLAGSQQLVDLHGRLDQVRCLGCEALTARADLQSELLARNPGFARAAASVIKPDGDAELADANYDRFEIVPCASCGGMLKPHVVFFGESVPKARVEQAMSALEGSRLLLIVGSSLVVYSGFRFARAAARLGIPIAIVNRGVTRADELAQLKLDGDIADILSDVVVGLG
jgi:NAD-dependent SIR2 family protein deacetylase